MAKAKTSSCPRCGQPGLPLHQTTIPCGYCGYPCTETRPKAQVLAELEKLQEKKPTIEELESLLNSGAEVPFEILPSGEIKARPTDLSREILLKIPSQIEIAEALHSVPSGPHRETIARMATALDCLRDGGWEFVEKAPKTERLLDLAAEVKRLEATVEAVRRFRHCDLDAPWDWPIWPDPDPDPEVPEETPEDYADRVLERCLRLICSHLGHAPVQDHCGLPEHDVCAHCMEILPGKAERHRG